MAKTLIVIAGPTAVGKTSLAIKLAQHYKTEILSADSRQFYREMDIGTAKPSAQELNLAKHHFINSLSVTENYSVGDFERDALKLIDQLFNKHDILIMVGGSGLFVNAVINGLDELPAANKEHRSKLNDCFNSLGIIYLQRKLQDVDPTYYNEVDINNPQRLIRALEVFETTGTPFSEFRNKIKKGRSFKIVQIGLNTTREILYRNINHRVDMMFENGLVAEVIGLMKFRHVNALNTVGYSELFDYFDGHITLEIAIELIKQNTRRFAKRQLTWFNKTGDIKWFEPDEFESITNYLDFSLGDLERVEQKS